MSKSATLGIQDSQLLRLQMVVIIISGGNLQAFVLGWDSCFGMLTVVGSSRGILKASRLCYAILDFLVGLGELF